MRSNTDTKAMHTLLLNSNIKCLITKLSDCNTELSGVHVVAFSILIIHNPKTHPTNQQRFTREKKHRFKHMLFLLLFCL